MPERGPFGPSGLGRLIAAQVFVHACMAGFRMAAPLLALRDGHSEAAVGILLALFALTQVFLSLPLGRYADRHGLRRPVAWAVGAATLGAGLVVVFPSYITLCLGALLTGGATGTASISLQRHVGKVARTPLELKQAFSWLSLGPAISNFVGPFIAGLVIDHGGFRAAFFVMALFPLVSWAWIRRATELPAPPSVAGQVRGKAWDLLREPSFRRLLIVNWFLSSCWDVHTFVVPVLGHERGLSASAIGTILGGFAIAATLVRMVLPALAERLQEHKVVTGAMVCTAGVFALYPIMHSAVAMGLCSVVLGLALGCVQPMVMSMLHQFTPAHRQGEAVALRLMAINASSVAMPLFFGVAGAVIGISGVFWGTGAIVAAGTRMAWRLGQHRGHH